MELKEIIVPLIVVAVCGLIKMYKDIAVIKRDIDGLADVVGTTRAKARRPKSDT